MREKTYENRCEFLSNMENQVETIVSRNGLLTWKVIRVSRKLEGRKKKFQRAVYTVVCERCGYQTTNVRATIERRKKCPGCSDKPAAMKVDKQGSCIALCDIGTVEFIREYQSEHSVSERVAVEYFVETVKAHLSEDDPANDSLTVESVRAKVRRLTGKKKDQIENCGGPPQDKNEKVKKYRIEADVNSVRTFLRNHMPEYMLLNIKSELNGGNVFSLTPSSK